MKKLEEVYREILDTFPDLTESQKSIYAEEFASRQRNGWRIPISTYNRCKEILYYKESLERPSPYYVDIFKINNYDHIKIVIRDLMKTVRIKLY